MVMSDYAPSIVRCLILAVEYNGTEQEIMCQCLVTLGSDNGTSCREVRYPLLSCYFLRGLNNVSIINNGIFLQG